MKVFWFIETVAISSISTAASAHGIAESKYGTTKMQVRTESTRTQHGELILTKNEFPYGDTIFDNKKLLPERETRRMRKSTAIV
ncbi:hypothetical protein [Burkholderia cepacia]|uniref:hypothetical protein n=1 Tax=Burkholderia cepacia TaxID=292 RepID=UPI002AB7B329|nr:hypothetical protein [Burkholderia cepacia]